MKWLSKPLRLEQRGWHLWFAWFPVCIGEYWYWLEYVERKYIIEYSYHGEDHWAYQVRGTKPGPTAEGLAEIANALKFPHERLEP